jgi:hypothetical protein
LELEQAVWDQAAAGPSLEVARALAFGPELALQVRYGAQTGAGWSVGGRLGAALLVVGTGDGRGPLGAAGLVLGAWKQF